ncbi:cytochrome P450 [Kitasatospora sp. GP82]|uniref:cytochrome P450 n=1 Tax=Kitasatospora sp. GP82 TaxID=3035089 RepID=UPI00247690DE|nr:cytochrome P450 [Kitasatospora sp. GP82]MDH6125646.1 cytochrome P450 [Kitasatospora sp. GP82]
MSALAGTASHTDFRTAGTNPAHPEFWSLPASERAAAFARLRALDRPVFCTDPRTGKGFHALVRHADVVAASRTPDVFISAPGVTTPEPARWVRAVFGDSMVNLDDPRHADLRRIVSRAFTPRLIAKVEDDIRRVATQIVDELLSRRAGGGDDFVSAVAAELPYQVICNMMGIPEKQRRRILEQINHASERTGVARSRLRVPGLGLRALARMQGVIAALGRERRRRPTDDLISALVTADVDGKHLNSRELGAFFSFLLVAGVETTRNALAHGLHLLTEHPDQRELLLSDLDTHLGGAVEEIVRYSTPIIQFRRTLAVDHDLDGTPLAQGDKVVLFFGSANRDEAVFTEPDVFDITRSPNPHLGFGGGGPHFCLGAYLARQKMKVLLRELYTRLPDLSSVGGPELIPSSFDNRVRSLRFTFTQPA